MTSRVVRRTKAQNQGSQVSVVNMIPKSLSGEEQQDSEPTIAVNPANPMQIAGSAFTPDPAGGDRAPIYVSLDGGASWTLNSIVPSTANDGSMTADITVAFGNASNILYAGIIRFPFPGDKTRLNILRTTNFQATNMMTVLSDRTGKGVDQPYVQAVTVANGAQKGSDRIYVGNNDFNAPNGHTATIDMSLNASGAKPKFKSIRIESRTTPGQDGPSIRPAIHSDGTVYGAFYAWRSFNQSTGAGTADVIVVRDDKGGAGSPSFAALVDPNDHLAGIRIAQGVTFRFNAFLGLQRIGGDVAIAVDPSDSAKVYAAWADNQGATYTIHLRASSDRGATWSAHDLRTIPHATNPALAVNTDGKAAFLYQQLNGAGASQRWNSTVELANSGGWHPVVLASVPANNPAKKFDPYIGDYDHLMSVGKDFYGVFSASNIPDMANFPNGVIFQRNADFKRKVLLDIDGSSQVAVSIDPFFFRIDG